MLSHWIQNATIIQMNEIIERFVKSIPLTQSENTGRPISQLVYNIWFISRNTVLDRI